MISSPDLYKEIAVVNKALEGDIDEASFRKLALKMDTIQAKLLHNIRTNQTAIMKKMGVEKVRPQRPDEERPDEEQKPEDKRD